jgi:hypothetical protein
MVEVQFSSSQTLQFLFHLCFHDVPHSLPAKAGANRRDAALFLLQADEFSRQHFVKVTALENLAGWAVDREMWLMPGLRSIDRKEAPTPTAECGSRM